jgi:hypothetical protein
VTLLTLFNLTFELLEIERLSAMYLCSSLVFNLLHSIERKWTYVRSVQLLDERYLLHPNWVDKAVYLSTDTPRPASLLSIRLIFVSPVREGKGVLDDRVGVEKCLSSRVNGIENNGNYHPGDILSVNNVTSHSIIISPRSSHSRNAQCQSSMAIGVCRPSFRLDGMATDEKCKW